MQVQYYPPHRPDDLLMALEYTLRRAYPVPEAPTSDHLDTLLRCLMEKARRMECRLV